MKEHTGIKFLDELFAFLDDAIDSGAEVHIVDKSDPDKVVEHVFAPEVEVEDDVEIELPFDNICDICEEEHTSCDDCPHVDECYEEEMERDPEEEFDVPCCGVPDIDRIVFSDPATIVFWEDGTKTVVKCMKGERFERYAGFAAACMKKMFGSTSRAKAIMDDLAVEQVSAPKKNRAVAVPDLTEAFTITQSAHEQAIQEAVNEALG